jgi:hypothetical protein
MACIRRILADGRGVCSRILRAAPGCDSVRFAQTLLWAEPWSSPAGHVSTYVSPPVKQDYETLALPCGLLWAITLHCTVRSDTFAIPPPQWALLAVGRCILYRLGWPRAVRRRGRSDSNKAARGTAARVCGELLPQRSARYLQARTRSRTSA